MVRTGRGLELGEVLAPPDGSPDAAAPDGSILRGVTAEDQLLAARLERNRQRSVRGLRARGWRSWDCRRC